MYCTPTKAEDTCLIHHQDGTIPSHLPKEPSKENRIPESTETLVEASIQTLKEKTIIPHDIPSKEDPSVENQDDHDDFPEGGLRAWSVVLGTFCALTTVFGTINTTAVFQQYLSTHQLAGYSPSQIGWIFSLGLFITFFCGVQTGPVFDAQGPRYLLLGGSILLFVSMMLLGECTKYWHFIMVYSVLNGLGGALVNTPAVASLGHYFLEKRGNAMGIAFTSGSVGGVVFPLMLQKLLPAVGFAWSTRILGFVLLALLVVANLLIKSRLPHTNGGRIWPDLTVFRDLGLTFCTLGIFFMEWGLFVPLTYISSYAVDHGRTTAFGFQLVAMFNAGSFFGRWLPGLAADMIGRYNTIIITIILCAITTFAFWLPAGSSEAMIILFAVCFGFVSGSNLSLSPVCVGQLCDTKHYGRYYATSLTVVSFGTLTGVPIAGQILSASNGSYEGLVIFAGMSYVAASVCFILSRASRVGLQIRAKW